MIVGDLTEMRIVDVFDRGEPNKECIAIQVNEALNIGKYGVMLGSSAGQASAVPFRDQLYWFGDGVIKSGDWIFLYTGAGEARQHLQENNVNHSYSIYWGRPTTLFAQSFVVPILFRIDAVDVLPASGDVPQIT